MVLTTLEFTRLPIWDALFYYAEGIGSIDVTRGVNLGDSFTTHYQNVDLAATTQLCYNWYHWIPGTGTRYIGFRDYSNAPDTIHGWIKG